MIRNQTKDSKSNRQCKVVMLGDQAVGKSSIINRFVKDEFDKQHNPTIGIDFLTKSVSVGDKTVRLQLWDTAGQERFRSLVPGYLKDAVAALLVFDVTNENSFEQLGSWIEIMRQLEDIDPKIFIIANKSDLTEKRVVTSQRLIAYANKQGVRCFEISAKEGNNIKDMFKEIATDIVNYQPRKSPNTINLAHEDDEEQQGKSRCF